MARSCFSREVYASQKNCKKLVVMKRTVLGTVLRCFQIANWFHQSAFKITNLDLWFFRFGQYWDCQSIALRWMIQSLIFFSKIPKKLSFLVHYFDSFALIKRKRCDSSPKNDNLWKLQRSKSKKKLKNVALFLTKCYRCFQAILSIFLF